jgi:hypothetical protein
MKEPAILMDESELSDSVLTEEELRSFETVVGGKYHDLFLRPRDDDT